MSILKTTDYAMFNKNHSNRPINNINLRRVMASITANNMLEFRPILVNSRMEVVDGQHRLEAAKALGIPIFYQINKLAENTDIILLNANQKRWDYDDYMNFYLNEGRVEYQKLADFCKSADISVMFFLRNCSSEGEKLGGVKGGFKNGSFKFPEADKLQVIRGQLKHGEEVLELLKTYMGYKINTDHVTTLMRALIMLQKHPDYVPQVMLDKLSIRLDKFRKCSDLAGYLDMFKAMYNWKNQSPLE